MNTGLLGQNEIKFPCPNCEGHLLCDLSFCGTTTVCPHCQDEISIPRLPSQKQLLPANTALKKILPAMTNGQLDQTDARIQLMDILKRSGCHPLNFDIEPEGPLDFMSHNYLVAVIGTNIGLLLGYNKCIQSCHPLALDAAPAQELFRLEARKMQRDWPARWADAGGEFYDGGRMIARKDYPVWSDISAFDRPYPPFDYGSGMWIRDISRYECGRHGILQLGESLEPFSMQNLKKPPYISIGDLNISASLMVE